MIDKNGNVIIKLQYYSVTPFYKNGLAEAGILKQDEFGYGNGKAILRRIRRRNE